MITCLLEFFCASKHVARKLIRGGSGNVSEGVQKFKNLHTVYLNTFSPSVLIFTSTLRSDEKYSIGQKVKKKIIS